jgi:hypothetical protein
MALTLNLLVAFCLSDEQTQAFGKLRRRPRRVSGVAGDCDPISHDQAFKWQQILRKSTYDDPLCLAAGVFAQSAVHPGAVTENVSRSSGKTCDKTKPEPMRSAQALDSPARSE